VALVRKAGEFYTPQQVSSILAQLVTVGKDKSKACNDPTCGSGSAAARSQRSKDVRFTVRNESYHLPTCAA
jgi:type I restriction enzyme M protein